jgi:hypothetical protein
MVQYPSVYVWYDVSQCLTLLLTKCRTIPSGRKDSMCKTFDIDDNQESHMTVSTKLLG